MKVRTLTLFALVTAAAPGLAQAPTAVPSPADVLGYELGERFTDHAGVVRYMEALDAASPRVEVRRYGTTVEGRPLLQVVIAREDYLARLDEILALNRELSNPETPPARAGRSPSATRRCLLQLRRSRERELVEQAALWTAGTSPGAMRAWPGSSIR